MMSIGTGIDLTRIREAMAGLEISPRVEPNEVIDLGRVFLPDGHRSVLDMKRQLVIGNRGVGKSFWTHALKNPTVRKRLAQGDPTAKPEVIKVETCVIEILIVRDRVLFIASHAPCVRRFRKNLRPQDNASTLISVVPFPILL